MSNWIIDIKNGSWNVCRTHSNNGFTSSQMLILKPVLEVAYTLSEYKGAVRICRGKKTSIYTEETPAAVIGWFPNIFKPKITIAPEVFDKNDIENFLGITLTHELIHARQGCLRVFWENFIWTILRKNGDPPIEEEAYNSVNLWWDYKKLF
jgi:hypothetical protein